MAGIWILRPQKYGYFANDLRMTTKLFSMTIGRLTSKPEILAAEKNL
jgi:hypothetical protein